MKQFKRQIVTTVGAILIALGMIGINADRAIAQGKARKGTKVHSGAGINSTIISPRDPASGLPTGKRANQTRATSSLSDKNDVAIETIERGRRGRARPR